MSDDDDTLSALSDDAESARAAAPAPRLRRASDLRFATLERMAGASATEQLETRNQAARESLRNKSLRMQSAQNIVSRTIQRRASSVLAAPPEAEAATPQARRVSNEPLLPWRKRSGHRLVELSLRLAPRDFVAGHVAPRGRGGGLGA